MMPRVVRAPILLSFDCESNGLLGPVFAVGAAVYRHGVEVDHWVASCPIEGEVDEWVAANVCPTLHDIPITHPTTLHLAAAFAELLGRFKPDRVLTHVPWPVEAGFLRLAYDEPFTGPFPLLDLASMLHAAGEDDTSEDAYMARHNLIRPEGQAQNPLNDARAAALVYHHLMGERAA